MIILLKGIETTNHRKSNSFTETGKYSHSQCAVNSNFDEITTRTAYKGNNIQKGFSHSKIAQFIWDYSRNSSWIE